jgi:hypothetical protein
MAKPLRSTAGLVNLLLPLEEGIVSSLHRDGKGHDAR